MDTFLRLDLGRPVYFLDATAVALPGDIGNNLYTKVMGFHMARILAGDLGDEGADPALIIIKVGAGGIRVPLGMPAAEMLPLLAEAEALGAVGRQMQASARYQGAWPFAPFA